MPELQSRRSGRLGGRGVASRSQGRSWAGVIGAPCPGPQFTPWVYRATGNLGNWDSGRWSGFQNSRSPEFQLRGGRMPVDDRGVRQRACFVAHIGYGRIRDPNLHYDAALLGIWLRITSLS